MNKVIFSGIQPTGGIHLGNYLGAIKQWVALQYQADEAVFCIVDLHAITLPQDPKALRDNIYSLAALYLASGIDPKKSTLFVQSCRPEHSELAWILNCSTTLGELNRMTQFKDKSGDSKEKVSAGLFNYPVLMAADILLYNATDVPVGEDQKQHVELTRDIAQRFNSKYGDIFTLPNPIINKSSARIMGLDNPLKKMSKSAPSSFNYIAMNDSADEIREKIKRAVTDSGSEIKVANDKPAVSNLLKIYSEVTGREIGDLEKKYQGRGYGEFKKDLAEAIIEYISPIQDKYNDIISDKKSIAALLEHGAEKLAPVANKTINKVYNALGLGI